MTIKFSKKSVARLNCLYQKVENPAYSIDQIARETEKVVAQLKPFERPLYNKMSEEMRNDPFHTDEILRKYGLTPGRPGYQKEVANANNMIFEMTQMLLRFLQPLLNQDPAARIITPEEIEGFDELSTAEQGFTRVYFDAFIEAVFENLGPKTMEGSQDMDFAYGEATYNMPNPMLSEEQFAERIWPILEKCGMSLEDESPTKLTSWKMDGDLITFTAAFPCVIVD